jgi:uncharacterized protein with NAD-binding domain and iron-sulfur cluster
VRKRVAILGGGVAGMSAAHELIERGFDVVVYEKQPVIPGGKARSLPVPRSGTDDRKDLPAEHGFRFFPGFYRHLPDTMQRIPYGHNGNVYENLTETTESQLAKVGANALYTPTHFPTNPLELTQAFDFFRRFGRTFGISAQEIRFFIGRLVVLMTSCEERRFACYEKLSWWDFIKADKHSDAYKKYLADRMSRSLVAVQPKVLSTRTGGYILLQFLYDFSWTHRPLDRVLTGPTNDRWIDPWLLYLTSRGVEYHRNAVVKTIHCTGQRITGVTIQENRKRSQVVADYYIAALPVEVIVPLISKEMIAAEPKLDHLRLLRYSGMNGIQFFLKRNVTIVHGHSSYCDAPWALTSISQPQFWPQVELRDYGDGSVRGIVSVIISDWEAKGDLIKKAAKDCTRDEIAEEVWFQLKRHLNGTTTVLEDGDRVREFLPPSIDFTDPGHPHSVEPLLINTTGSWDNRPDAMTRIENFFLAADFVRTYTDLATMEGANEAARRAVNGILMAAGSNARGCDVWPLSEPWIFGPQRLIDRWRFEHGLPHMVPMGLAKEAWGEAE